MKAIAKYNGHGEVRRWRKGVLYCLSMTKVPALGVRVKCEDNGSVEWYDDMEHFHVFWKNLSFNK